MQQEAELKGLKVIELKSKLSKLGLDTKGRKDKLIERLLSHFESAKKETKAEVRIWCLHGAICLRFLQIET